ncbi:MAG: hydroxymethylglutaryl-CoA lyase [Candidatus Dormibacteraceae bacterium]
MNIARYGQVRLVEVFPRDGLQALEPEEYGRLSTESKVNLVSDLIDCGMPEIEMTGFGHPRVIPAVADAEEVTRRLSGRRDVVLRALAPNLRGLTRAIGAGLRKAVFFVVTSETYQAKNVHMTVAENVALIAEMKKVAVDSGLEYCVSVGTAFLCPYDGPTDPKKVFGLVEQFAEFGFSEISLADSIGMAGPREVYQLCADLRQRWPDIQFGLHLHNRNGLALANVLAGLEAGIRRFETAVLGIGAGVVMPVDKRTMGNVATEEVVNLMDMLGVPTGVDLNRLRSVARQLADTLQIKPTSPTLTLGTVADLLASTASSH